MAGVGGLAPQGQRDGSVWTAASSAVSYTIIVNESHCQSQIQGRGYACYYVFTLEQESQVTIDLESDVDPYLYLREGEARSGEVLDENDPETRRRQIAATRSWMGMVNDRPPGNTWPRRPGPPTAARCPAPATPPRSIPIAEPYHGVAEPVPGIRLRGAPAGKPTNLPDCSI